MFALMIFIYIRTIPVKKNLAIPYAVTSGNSEDLNAKSHLYFRPEFTIPKRIYSEQHLDRIHLLSAPAFCDIADELIDMFQDNQLVFSDQEQFNLLKSQFRTIGYNFNVKPVVLWHKKMGNYKEDLTLYLRTLKKSAVDPSDYAERFIDLMAQYQSNQNYVNLQHPSSDRQSHLNLSTYKTSPGVYFFLNADKDVIYVGKAKNIKKRLQSHFCNRESATNLDYSEVRQITVEYTGNDAIAQLVETENIKALQPKYNVQQISDAAPFIINKGRTASGISRLKIIRKDIADNMPERYFNRLSVKKSLVQFCSDYDLCRKHCGLEHVKGPCSKSTVNGEKCVCSKEESIEHYNNRFSLAFQQFQRQKSRKLYKLKGRNKFEDAFIYIVNGIYEGYGFIQKDDSIYTTSDILGHLNARANNYETSRIIAKLDQTVSKDNILYLNS